MPLRPSILLLAILGPPACGGPPPAPSSPATAATDEWKGLSWEERHDAMTFTVLPNMARAFQRFAGSPAPEMTCRTCHGLDAEKVAYAMPHGLTALDPRHMPRADSPDPKQARITKFMTDEVTPDMASLLGEPPYDPRTRSGFGCFACHPVAGGAP